MRNLIYKQTGRDPYYRIWHKPEKSIFIFVQSGSGSIVTKDKSYPMKGGTLCFIGEDKYHYTFPDHPEAYMRSKLLISSDELSKLLSTLYQSPRLLKIFNERQLSMGMLDANDRQHAEQIFDRLSRIPLDSEYFQAEIYSAVLQLVVLLSKNINVKSQDSFGAMQTAVEYINDHITEDITVERICANIYMSKYHFCRLFKAKIGLTVMEYVLKTRVMMAKDLLCCSDKSVTEISEDCGFSSISYFSRAFKNETGMTPMQYKKTKQIK